jgi:hypothetical protein
MVIFWANACGSVEALEAGEPLGCHVERSETSQIVGFFLPEEFVRDSSLRSE